MTRTSDATVRRKDRARLAIGVAGAVLAIGVLAGCGSPAPTGSGAPGSTVPATVGPPGATAAPPSPAASGSVPTGSPSGAVAADPTLLDLVPAEGLWLTYDPDTTARVAADPTLATSASALAIAVAVPAGELSPGSSAAPGADVAVVSVIRVRDPSADETWFRDWRDSYDDASCANAGGVTRHAETAIGGNTVFVGSCASGSFTYHVRIEGGAVVISLTSIGPGRIGQQIMEGLGS